MPLKLYPPREKNPSWQIRGTYLGKHVDRSSKALKRAIAQKVLRQIEGEIERGEFTEPKAPTFASAAIAYIKSRSELTNEHGERHALRKLLGHFGECPLSKINQQSIDGAAATLYPGATSATRNRQIYTPISAILRHAGIHILLRRPRGSGGNKQTSWLWPEQAEALFAEAQKLSPEFAALCITLCYTGMRLGEALGLTWNDMRLKEGFAYVGDSKNGEPRAIFLPPVAVAALANSGHNGGMGRVFPFTKSGHLYQLLKAAALKAGVDLPERSAFHIFRHTYGTWMRRYAGLDTRGLVGTGAWKDQKSAARYAHVDVSEESKRAVMLPVGAIWVQKQTA